jgi:hypothetical protein
MPETRNIVLGKPLLFSLALFPPIDYMAMMLFHHTVMVEAMENYQKQSYRNRYHILGPNGLQPLHIPIVKGERQHVPIMEITAGGPDSWKILHIRSLRTAYNNSPYFLYYSHKVEELIMCATSSLWNFALHSLVIVSDLLGRGIDPEPTDRFVPYREDVLDVRSVFHPKVHRTSINISPSERVYYQVFAGRHGFVHNLSVLDILFNEGPAAIHWLEKRYREIIENHFSG